MRTSWSPANAAWARLSVARFIHEHSDRSPLGFAMINCEGLPDLLFESALFGHRQGQLRRRLSGQARVAGVGTGRDGLPGRSRRPQCEDAGSAASVSRDRGIPAHRQRPRQDSESRPVRCQVDCLDDREPAGARGRRIVPGRSVSPAQRSFVSRCRRCANGATTSRPWSITSPDSLPSGTSLSSPTRLKSPAPSAMALCRADWPGNVRELKSVVLPPTAQRPSVK